jgi:predicted Zn-dependent protease
MPAFFGHLEELNRFNNNSALAFLQTHPVTAERLSEAQERASQYSVKMHPDSISFLLIREKARVRQLGKNDALEFYQQVLKNKRYANLDVVYYGMAYAKLAAQDMKGALASLEKIQDKTIKGHPAYYSLKGQILFAAENYNDADKVFTQGLVHYPTYKGLWLGQIDLYIRSKQPEKAIKQLEILSNYYPNDSDIWAREAVIYSDFWLNNPQKYHYALGNQLYCQNNFVAALSQYQLALQANKLSNNNGELNNIISAKMVDTQYQIKLSIN